MAERASLLPNAETASVEPTRLPWSRHTPNQWRAVRERRVAIACDADDAPKPIVEALNRDGHLPIWSTREGLVARARELSKNPDSLPPIDVVIVSERLLNGVDGIGLLAALCEGCAGASVVVLGPDPGRSAAMARLLREEHIFEKVSTLSSPVDLDDLRMTVMHLPVPKPMSGSRIRSVTRR